jgi:hypothetical protein
MRSPYGCRASTPYWFASGYYDTCDSTASKDGHALVRLGYVLGAQDGL